MGEDLEDVIDVVLKVKPLPETCQCIRCDRRLGNFMATGYQPNDGLAFYTRGHYGSTYFDPMDGSYLEIVVCDECVRAADARGIVHHSAVAAIRGEG